MGYEEFAAELSGFYETREPELARMLADSLAAGASVLDIGCGSGRDLAEFRRRGFDAIGVEPSEAMRFEALRAHHELDGYLFPGELPSLDLPHRVRDAAFDAIFCNAILQHLESGNLVPAFARIKELLNAGGRFAFSVPLAYPVDERGMDQKGRFYNLQPRAFWIDLLLRFGFELRHERVADEPFRPGRSWLQVVCVKPLRRGMLPLETIASVLSRDMKTTTYKFALLRALADLAIAGSSRCAWRGEEALVPIPDLVDLWIEYYYPLVDHGRYVPQGRATSGGKKDIAFRTALEALAREYRKRGGYFAMRRALRDPGSAEGFRAARALVERALRNGPAAFVGSERTGGKLFRTEGGFLVMDADLWIEFGRFSTWIKSAVLLRWTEYTKRLMAEGDSSAYAGVVLGLLLPDDPVREQGAYRDLMSRARAASPFSVWTGKPLSDNFDIDHAIPFSLWGNNDLWNLFPISRAENSRKSDLLPSLGLLYASRDRIGAHWSFMDRELTDQFRREVEYSYKFSIKRWDRPTSKRLFAAFASAVELTAQSAGGERWAG